MSKRTPDRPLKNKKGLLDFKMPLKGLKDKKGLSGSTVLYLAMKNKQKHAAHFLFIFHLFQNEWIAYETKSETKRSDKRSDRFFRMLRLPRNEV